MPVFAFPFALIALLAIPALLAIYWLRNRAEDRKVSSLLFWLDEKQRWEGGPHINRLQTPILFFLELLAILLLAAAAADSLVRSAGRGRPVIIVLDDSFSMLAGNDQSVRTLAMRAIEKELRGNRYDTIRFILAGESPQLLGEAANNIDQAVKLLQNWRCGAPAAKLEEAITFAFEFGDQRARALVVTDHAPRHDLGDSR